MRHLTLAVVALGIAASPIAAQTSTPIELGLDASLGIGLDKPQITTFSVPVRRVRVGFLVSPVWSIEPFAAVSHTSVGSSSSTGVGFGLGALYHLSQDRSRTAAYVRPFVIVDHTNLNGVTDDSFTAISAGGGIGFKAPVADRLAWRLEASASHGFKHDRVTASNEIRFYAGISFFTR